MAPHEEKDRMANPQIEKIRTMLAENPVVPEGASLEQMRAGFDAMGEAFPASPEIQSESVDIGGLPGAWFSTPGADPSRALLYFHGGGYAIGSLRSHREVMGRIAKAAGCRVLGIDYRLAPEHPFPAAVEDAEKAYRWMLDGGLEGSRVAFAGDSAGGGLTVAALLAAREAGLAMPGCAVCISPWADMTCSGESMETKAGEDPMVQREIVQQMATTYLAGGDLRAPLASPIFADLAGLPPLLIQVGSAETLLDDATRLESGIKRAGGDATLEVWDEMIHVWHLFAPMLDKGQEAIDRIGEFVRKGTS